MSAIDRAQIRKISPVKDRRANHWARPPTTPTMLSKCYIPLLLFCHFRDSMELLNLIKLQCCRCVCSHTSIPFAWTRLFVLCPNKRGTSTRSSRKSLWRSLSPNNVLTVFSKHIYVHAGTLFHVVKGNFSATPMLQSGSDVHVRRPLFDVEQQQQSIVMYWYLITLANRFEMSYVISCCPGWDVIGRGGRRPSVGQF